VLTNVFAIRFRRPRQEQVAAGLRQVSIICSPHRKTASPVFRILAFLQKQAFPDCDSFAIIKDMT
jgi:hypothetical protein